MKKLFVFVAAVVAALAVTAAASAGCMATVGLSSTPKPGLAAGKPWVVTLRVLQHGERILVTIVDRATHGIDTPQQYADFVRRYKGD